MNLDFFNLRTNGFETAIASALTGCNSGKMGIQGCCCASHKPSDLPAQHVPEQAELSLAQLGPILSDTLVPEFSVSVSHVNSTNFHYLQAVRLGRSSNFSVTDWNPQSLSKNCCPEFLNSFVFSGPPGRVNVQALLNHIQSLVEFNAKLNGPKLQIVFRSKSGQVRTFLLQSLLL